MARTFSVEIVSPDRVFYEGETDLLIMKGKEGEFAVMYDHEPTVIPVDIGSIRIRDDKGAFSMAACSTGVLTVKETKATVLIDSAEWIDEIDLERAIEAKKRAEERLHTPKSESKDIDYTRARAALLRAINRIKLRETIK